MGHWIASLAWFLVNIFLLCPRTETFESILSNRVGVLSWLVKDVSTSLLSMRSGFFPVRSYMGFIAGLVRLVRL